jgi:hypothetical protein
MREHWRDRGFLVGEELDGSESMSEDGEGSGSEDELRDEDSDAENSDEEPDIFDWDRFEAPGLSAWDKLGESYEVEAATGVFLYSSSSQI